MVENISAFILAGGGSRRMEKNKALLPLNNQLVVERIIAILKNIFQNVSIISNKPSDFKQFGLEVYQDIYPNLGPVAGIHSALTNSITDSNFIIACDTPLITEDLIRFLLEKANSSNVVLPYDNSGEYPLCALYSKKLLNRAEELLSLAKNGKGIKLSEFLSGTELMRVDITKFVNYNPENLMNMNNIDDYKKILAILSKTCSA